MRFGYIPFASEFIKDDAGLLSIISDYINLLNSIEGSRFSAEDINNDLPVFYFAVTGGTENSILSIVKERQKAAPNEPVYIMAHPANNSLPASLEVLACLQQNGIKGRIFYFRNAQDRDTLLEIKKALRDLEVHQQLSKSKIGLIGDPSDWLVASQPDYEIVKRKWGPEIVKINIEELKERILRKASAELSPEENAETAEMKAHLIKNAQRVVEPVDKEIDDALKVYLSLRGIIKSYSLNAITVRCFELVQHLKTTGCFGLSQLTDEGFISGCEGDLMSIIGMLWTNLLLNEIPWMANPAQLDEKSNSILLAHCTIPRKLIVNYSLRSHFESGLGVGIQGTIPNEPVTLLRLGGKTIEKIWLAEGEISRSGNAENLCRTQAEVKLSEGGTVKDLLNFPLGNHIILVKGHYMKKLQSWWDMMISS